MEKKQRRPFKDLGEYAGSGFDAVIKEILAERVKTPKVFELKPIEKLRANYSQRKNDWVNSKFEVDATDEGLKIGMYLAKGSGEIVHIAGSPSSFLNILGSIVVTLNGLELTEVVSEEEVNEFEKDVNTLINKLKGKESKGSG